MLKHPNMRVPLGWYILLMLTGQLLLPAFVCSKSSPEVMLFLSWLSTLNVLLHLLHLNLCSLSVLGNSDWNNLYYITCTSRCFLKHHSRHLQACGFSFFSSTCQQFMFANLWHNFQGWILLFSSFKFPFYTNKCTFNLWIKTWFIARHFRTTRH